MDEQNNNQEKENTLKKLLDSSYPLLQKFRDLCPGTFKHSQNLADIVEGVSISIGLDITCMRVISMYHDIGKIINPLCYSENQIDGTNIHDSLDAEISFHLISKHISDSAMILLHDDNFPRKLIKIITQHHGTTIMKQFFEKSHKKNENDFRYKSEKPSTVESAVLMICDRIEARSRSNFQNNGAEFNPKFIVEDTINALLADNQLDEVIIRLGDLQKIKETLIKELQGAYQKRVEYKN